MKLNITETKDVTDRVRLFTLRRSDGPLPTYSAGAHLDFDLGAAGTRSYSLIDFEPANSPPDAYQIAVQMEPDGEGGSRAMHRLGRGDTVEATDPRNSFELHDGDAPVLLIAGGIGITPIISFATELTRRGAPFAFHYAARSRDVCAFADQLADRFGNVLTLWFDDQQMIDLATVIGQAPDDAHIYCCGPKPMIEAVRTTAEAAGYPASRIRFELFETPQNSKDDKPFEVEINDGQVFTIPPGKTIIQVLEDAGVDLMYDCQRGDCGICQTQVLEGEPDHRDVVLSKAERDAGNVMQICVSRAKSARLKLDISAQTSTAKADRKREEVMATYTRTAQSIANLVRPNQVHRDAYVSEDIYRLEMKHLFANTWVFVGHDSQVANEGDYFTTQVGDQPVIMVRHSDGEVKVLYNRCPHKGTKIAIDRSGNTGKFFRCPYHAWSFKTDGCLLAIPLKKGYAKTDFSDTPNAKGMSSVGVVHNHRGFVFARLADQGMSFEEFFGDSLSSLDNLVDRAPAGRVEVAGPPLRYMHQCNWKMLVENQTDSCHPMVAHESSAGTAIRLFEESDWKEGEPKPMAMEIIAPFMSSYQFMEDMGQRTWPNGHGHSGVSNSIHKEYSEEDAYGQAMVEAYGKERASEILNENRHNTIYFPSIMVKGPIQILRNFIPLAANKTLVESWVYRLVGAPDYLLKRTAMYNRIINAPTSIVGHDDLEMYERAQEGLMTDGNEWVDLHRNAEDGENFDGEWVGNGTSERQMRNQFDAWRKFMLMTMDTPAQEAAE